MAGAGKPRPGRGRAALLLGGALSAGLLLAGCEKLSDLGVELDLEETATAPIGTPLHMLSDMPTVAPAEDAAPAEAAAADDAAAVLAAAEPAAGPAPADTHGPTLRPQPLAVSVMMAAARPAETTVAAATADAPAEGAASEPAPEPAVVAAAEAALPFEMVSATASAGEPLIGTAVVEAPASAVVSEAESPGIATLLVDLFAPLLEPAAGPAMASVPPGAPAQTLARAPALEMAAIGVVEDAGTQPSVDAAGIGFDIGPEVTGSSATGSNGDLTGLTEAQVEQLLGPPLAVRRDDPAESWQYATNDCVLDLFFYEQTGAWRVVHMEARTIAALDAPADSCVKSVLAGRVLPSRTS